MSHTLRRTVFYDNSSEVVRFFDFALVSTTLGTMVEPFQPNARLSLGTAIQNFDPEDDCSRIDEMRPANIHTHTLLLSGGGTQALHGGTAMPRVGK